MADIMDLFDQETAAPAVAVNPADAEREARLKQMLGMQPADFEDAAYKRFWKRQYGVDEKSSGIKRFLAGLAEGGSKLAQGKDRPLVMDRARKEGLEDYTAAQRTGLGELKLLDAEQKQQQNLASTNHFKALAAQAQLGKLALQMAQRGDSKELIDAKIVQLGKQGGLTDAQIAKVQADTEFTKKKTNLFGLNADAQNEVAMQGQPNANAIDANILRRNLGKGMVQQLPKALFPTSGGASGPVTTTSSYSQIVEDPIRGKVKIPMERTSTRSGSGQAGPNPATMNLVQQLLGGGALQLPQPGATQAPQPGGAAPQPVVPPIAAPTKSGAAAANRPPSGGVRPLIQQATGQSNERAWREKVPFLTDAYKSLVPGFKESEWEPPAVYAAGLGITPKTMADPKRIAAQEAVSGFRNLAATAAIGFMNDELKDAVGPMAQLKNTMAKYSKSRPDLAIATSTMSGRALADMVRSISGLTVSDAEQRRLEGLVANANTSPQEFMKMATYVNMMQQRGEIANSLNLGPELTKHVLGDPQLGQKLFSAWQSIVGNLEMVNKARKMGLDYIEVPKDGKMVRRKIPAKYTNYDPDSAFRRIIWEDLQARFPDSPFLPRKVAK